jgi:hypothetical protein
VLGRTQPFPCYTAFRGSLRELYYGHAHGVGTDRSILAERLQLDSAQLGRMRRKERHLHPREERCAGDGTSAAGPFGAIVFPQ